MIAAVTKIVGEERVSNKEEILEKYSGDFTPSLVVWPESTDEVAQIVAWANSKKVAVVPVSSGEPRRRGTSTPKVSGAIIVDLSRMKKIIRIDLKNKVAMVEAGVTYSELIPELEANGLRPLMPLLPKASKSVVASCLDKEPITTPRFHWDSSDPLLCTETIFGNGDVFRTGAAAGPGTLEEQWKSGQAQKNPMGPSQFDPFRIIQGSQGTIGIVTWISMKCETRAEQSKVYLAGADDLEKLYPFAYRILKRKLSDDLFILNRASLASALGAGRDEIGKLREELPEWILILSVAGFGLLATEELAYREADTLDIAGEFDVKLVEKMGAVSSNEVQSILGTPCLGTYWKFRYSGACFEVNFLTKLNETFRHWKAFVRAADAHGISSTDVGAYLQPTIQGTNTHCCFDIYYDPSNPEEVEHANSLYLEGSKALMEQGAFFHVPSPAIADTVFGRSSAGMISALKTVKNIFDPNHVLSPGNLCFKEVPK